MSRFIRLDLDDTGAFLCNRGRRKLAHCFFVAWHFGQDAVRFVMRDLLATDYLATPYFAHFLAQFLMQLFVFLYAWFIFQVLYEIKAYVMGILIFNVGQAENNGRCAPISRGAGSRHGAATRRPSPAFFGSFLGCRSTHLGLAQAVSCY